MLSKAVDCCRAVVAVELSSMQLHVLHACSCMHAELHTTVYSVCMEHATPTVLHAGSELDWEINVSAHIFSILQNEAAKLPKNPPRTPTLEVMSKVLWSMCILATAYRWLP